MNYKQKQKFQEQGNELEKKQAMIMKQRGFFCLFIIGTLITHLNLGSLESALGTEGPLHPLLGWIIVTGFGLLAGMIGNISLTKREKPVFEG